ncbi:MAG: ketopantoate reductase C-terminal domain-containing protein, partial [Pseudomonadota bacterium]
IIVTTKATAIPSVAETLAGTTAPVLSLLNGPRAATALAEPLGRAVIPGMVPWNAAWLSPELLLVSGAGKVAVAETPETTALAEIAGTSSAPVAPQADIDGTLWGKLLLNLVNPVNALSGMALKDMLSDRAWRLRYRDAYVEALGVLKAAGIRPAKVAPLPPGALPTVLSSPDWLFSRVFLPMQKLADGATTSMAQDLAAGRETEIAFLNGAIVDLAAEHGVGAPVNAALVAEILAHQSG